MKVQYRVLWLERLGGMKVLVPFSGRVYETIADAESEARCRREAHNFLNVMIEVRRHSDEEWPHPLTDLVCVI